MNNRMTISKFDQPNFEGHTPSTLVIHISCFARVETIEFDKQGKEILQLVLPCLDFTLEQQYGCEYHMITGVGSSSTHAIPSSFT
jgi:hypothetical protein